MRLQGLRGEQGWGAQGVLLGATWLPLTPVPWASKSCWDWHCDRAGEGVGRAPSVSWLVLTLQPPGVSLASWGVGSGGPHRFSSEGYCGGRPGEREEGTYKLKMILRVGGGRHRPPPLGPNPVFPSVPLAPGTPSPMSQMAPSACSSVPLPPPALPALWPPSSLMGVSQPCNPSAPLSCALNAPSPDLPPALCTQTHSLGLPVMCPPGLYAQFPLILCP